MTNPAETQQDVNLDKCWNKEKKELSDEGLNGISGGVSQWVVDLISAKRKGESVF